MGSYSENPHVLKRSLSKLCYNQTMADAILTTKLYAPPRQLAAIRRSRLTERLDEALHQHQRLTLVSAPAGYGKTTLVAEWTHATLDRREPAARMAWLSLEDADNDAARFLTYWIASIRSIDETIGQSALSLLGMPQIPHCGLSWMNCSMSLPH